MNLALLRALRVIVCFSLVFVVVGLAFGAKQNYGKFVGHLDLRLFGDRNAEVLSEFVYEDARMKRWAVPRGAIVNGASIPRWLWSVAGSPWTGNYRQASVVHDYFCSIKAERWQDVHRIFYEACLCGGVGELQAKIFYSAVYMAGPRWGSIEELESDGFGDADDLPEELKALKFNWHYSISDQEMQDVKVWVEGSNPSLDDIERKLEDLKAKKNPEWTVETSKPAN